jgi:hypothetical protein
MLRLSQLLVVAGALSIGCGSRSNAFSDASGGGLRDGSMLDAARAHDASPDAIVDAHPDAPPDAHPDAAPDAPPDAAPVTVVPPNDLTSVVQTAYVKASNTYQFSTFGYRVAMSLDGTTMAIAAPQEPSAATGINGDQTDRSAGNAGAVYIFTYGTSWTQQAYIKASDTLANAEFGTGLALSLDGSTLAVGATGLSSTPGGGTVYIFTRSGTTWTQQARFKASNSRGGDDFGFSLSLSGDGSMLAVGADGESSNATGIDGDQSNTSEMHAGAAYIFTRSGTSWTQRAYIKASNTAILDDFGISVALSADTTTLAVGACAEPSGATGINGDQADVSQSYAGAVYVFTRSGGTWSQQAYVKASNTRSLATFGQDVALSADGSHLVVGSDNESSAATGINGNQADTSAGGTGAVYSFDRVGDTWSQDAYIKPSDHGGSFGRRLTLSADGAVLVVGAIDEAAYVFVRPAGTWSQLAYVTASNAASGGSAFGSHVAVSADGSTFVVGAMDESSGATGIDGNQLDTSQMDSGAAYVFR